MAVRLWPTWVIGDDDDGSMLIMTTSTSSGRGDLHHLC